MFLNLIKHGAVLRQRLVFCAFRRLLWFWVEARDSGKRWRFSSGLIQAKFFLRKLMRPFVDESWELTSAESWSSGSIFFASCLPSSTLSLERKHYHIFKWVWNHKTTFLLLNKANLFYLITVTFSCYFRIVFMDKMFVSHGLSWLPSAFSFVVMVTHCFIDFSHLFLV